MHSTDLLTDGFHRVHDGVTALLDGTEPGDLDRRPGGDANPVGWLLWHLLRVQDDHVSEVAGQQQVWPEGWSRRAGLPLDEADTGYGHDRAQVDAVRVDADLLRGYAEAVHARTVRALEELSDADLDRVVDDSYDPPVTVGVRLVSVLEDDLQHLGQAAYALGQLRA
ncbi:DinB family protein [Jannaschia sp. R86511]|uniref:mycothiol transferase n=1 Tax=Jannaschia sp. R86511 TaxID=3093853 RepID=UPI0036D225E1